LSHNSSLFFFFWDKFLLCSPGWPQTHRSLVSASGITGMYNHTHLVFLLTRVLTPSWELHPQDIIISQRLHYMSWGGGHIQSTEALIKLLVLLITKYVTEVPVKLMMTLNDYSIKHCF
jgi:hypothetical protein